MNKFVLALVIILTTTYTLWSQTVLLHIETKTDSLTESSTFKFNSFDEAEEQLKFKTDSLKQSAYPFLKQKQTIKKNNLHATLELNRKIDSIHITVEERHIPFLPKDILPKDNKISIPYSKVENFLNSIVYKLKNEGSSFGKTSLTHIKVTGENVMEADLKIETGLKRTVDKVNIRGYSSLSKTYVSRFSNLKTGKTFVESDIQNKTEQLNNIPFIRVTKPTEVLFKKDSTELFVYLEKVNSNSFDGFLGFGSTDENNFQLNGYLNMVLLNNLDFGERLSIIYKNDGTGQQTFEGNIKLPFLLKSPLSLEAGLRLFRRDSSFSNSSQLLELNYQLNEKISLEGGIEFTTSTNTETEAVISTSEIIGYNSTFYGLGFSFLKLNSRERFDENTFLKVRAAFGNRKAKTNSDQYKLSLTGQHQISLNARNKIYLSLSSQILISDAFVNNELFRFGGVNSIRGFAENSLIANRFAVLQTEYRYLLDANLFANTVLDLGNYKNKLDDINENNLGYGIGLGLRSNAGIFRLILANSVSNNQNTTFSNSKIHISFTSFF
ncbi:BamA/TamA family outer membrane protein [Psychroflexus sp. CAK57W]|uniref:ShlB/FhaC/HecB family hemolysin secretion/activation protein n=1 Tax=Psychroflexus curvus TaxID=2873595 RepID=UPI001CCD9155|nr:ShlB/FhaC/HecB family hemolysin secretion/activation protein [Psychroflexus curvus]MBZ9788271.1 BamA/TamA family outer membrane protein [Psychroflexus curvus]